VEVTRREVAKRKKEDDRSGVQLEIDITPGN